MATPVREAMCNYLNCAAAAAAVAQPKKSRGPGYVVRMVPPLNLIAILLAGEESLLGTKIQFVTDCSVKQVDSLLLS